MPKYTVADSKLYTKANLRENLSAMPFVTRVPSNIKLLKQEIIESLNIDSKKWDKIDESNRCITRNVNHFGLKQRWIVVYSKQKKEKVQKTVEKYTKSEREKLEKIIKRHSNQTFMCKKDAEESVKRISKGIKWHEINLGEVYC